MKKCIWEDICTEDELCDICYYECYNNCEDYEDYDIYDVSNYISREEFYKDWFEYLERDDRF